MIKVEGVSKFFGSKAAVQNISFEVQEGEHLILLGTSGCGKTTTLKMINRLIAASSGSVTINGININDQSPETLRRGIGYVLQHNSLFPHYTVAENIAVVPGLLRWSKQKIQTRTLELLEKLHLQEQYLSRYPYELSGGEGQRVNLARALVANPPILLMDEPFGALDPVTRVAIRKEFIALEEFKRKTTIMVTHDVPEAFELADRICLMDNGEVKQLGTPAELLFHPANEFVTGFLSDAHLQLGLSITKVKDLWPYLNPDNVEMTGIKTLSANTSIWHLMQEIAKGNQVMVPVKNDLPDSVKNISTAMLLEAFNQYKRQS
jgi:osmoprotectant transport system ATP-binding protein